MGTPIAGMIAASARWSWGLLRRRTWILVGMAASVALSVAFVSALGSFATSSQSSLTSRAARSVAIDWQVQVTPQGTPAAVSRALHQVPGVRTVLPVDYARISGLTGSVNSTTRTTGTATVVSLPSDYAATTPGEIRYLVGAHTGVLLQQQTAANLGAGPGSVITAETPTGPVPLVVGGVVDLPQADSFFQVVGAPAGAGATAPPDNVVIVPPATFARLTNGVTVVHQFHTVLDHAALPADPAAAADSVTRSANHLAVAVAGGALVGDNLAASLSAAREDAIYARLLFLLLGLPGLALALIVASLLVGLRADSRRRESALLLLRGADLRTVTGIAMGESLVVAVGGIGVGVLLGELCTHLVLSGVAVSASWLVAAGAIGLVLAVVTQSLPAVRAATRFAPESVAVAATRVPSTRQPWFLRMGLDFILLGAAALISALNARNGYRVVVVPEGVPVTAVNYGALLGPALAWPGLLLLAWRVTAMVAARRTGKRALRHDRGAAPELVAATVRRRRQIIARGATGLAAAIGLGVSTAIFTATYDQQSRLDVALTVGSDVSATALPGTVVGPGVARTIALAPSVTAVQPLVHRFAYVGPDLQDLFGIQPRTIGQAAALQNSFVPGSTIASTLGAMATTRDGVLLSAETIRDYQLHPGDTIRLRLPVGHAGYQPVPFHVVGTISEFPTAPKDSFIVANSAYVDAMTHSNAVSTFLVASSDPSKTAAGLRAALGRGWHVRDITSARGSVVTASGLAATDLSALARLELGFALAFAFACSGLALGLGIAERRRALIVLGALGATTRQRSRFLNAEGATLLTAGIVGGGVVGVALGYLLVAILTGIFDPPPDGLNIPAVFVSVLVGAVVVVGAGVVFVVGRTIGKASPSQLRDL
jgi:putative ABC transport system permease protein